MLGSKAKEFLAEFKRTYIDTCKKCGGSGVPCSCRDTLHYAYVALNSNIPVQHMPLTLDSLMSKEVQVVKQQITEYLKNLEANIRQGTGLLLYGGHGTGKTSLGCIVLKEAVKKGKSVYFTSLDTCVNLTTGGWYDAEKRTEFNVNILNSDLLLIDDIGNLEITTGRNWPLIQSTLTSLFKDRSNNLKSTIITSNFTPEQIESKFGTSLYSMFMQHLKFIECPSKVDYRQHSLSPNKAKDIIEG